MAQARHVRQRDPSQRQHQLHQQGQKEENPGLVRQTKGTEQDHRPPNGKRHAQLGSGLARRPTPVGQTASRPSIVRIKNTRQYRDSGGHAHLHENQSRMGKQRPLLRVQHLRLPVLMRHHAHLPSMVEERSMGHRSQMGQRPDGHSARKRQGKSQRQGSFHPRH